MVVFPGGKTRLKRVSSRAATVRVSRRRRCRVGSRLPLAVLWRSRVGRVRLRDYGSCSRRRAADSGGLFVRAIGRHRNRGRHGWAYKLGRRGATAGAADPTGPFGSGRRLRRTDRVTWFYCRLTSRGCQRSLVLRATGEAGALAATVVGYDDEGDGVRVAGATVHVAGRRLLTDADGRLRVALPAGGYRLHASKPGLVRSFPERVTVR